MEGKLNNYSIRKCQQHKIDFIVRNPEILPRILPEGKSILISFILYRKIFVFELINSQSECSVTDLCIGELVL